MRREPKVVLVLLGWHSGNSRAAAYCPTRKLSATNTRLCRASVGGAIGWQTDDGTKVCGCEKQETRGRVVSARTPTRAPSIVSWSTRARSLFSSLRTRWRTSCNQRVLSSCPVAAIVASCERDMLLLPCLPERVAVHDLLGRGLTAAGRVQGGAATPP